MKTFELIDAQTIGQAAQKRPNSAIKAGGTDLLGMMKDNLQQPETVVSIKTLKELNYINYKIGSDLEIGALTTLSDLADHAGAAKSFPILVQAARQVASPQLRNVGTVGGNLCQRPRCWYFRGEFDCIRKGGDTCFAVDGENKFHCIIGGGPCFIVHPSDLAVALLALDAKVEIQSGEEKRIVPIKDFFILPEQDETRENILKDGEILTRIYVPSMASGARSQFIKFQERASWDFAVVSVAVVLRMDGKKIREGKIAFGGVAPKPWLDEELNNKLAGSAIDTPAIKALAESALTKAEPMSKNDYKIILARNLLKSALMDLAG